MFLAKIFALRSMGIQLVPSPLLCQNFPVINSCAINRTMIDMSIKRISVLNLCHVLKPFVKFTPGQPLLQ